MPNGEKKGITVRIDADLHAEVSQYLRDHSMTMAEFVSLALDDELHPKYQMKEGNSMANMKTIAVQVPEDLFQRIKDYLQRNNMTQKQFLIGLIRVEDTGGLFPLAQLERARCRCLIRILRSIAARVRRRSASAARGQREHHRCCQNTC